VRQAVDPDAQRADLLDAVEDLDLDSRGMQRQRCSEPADASARDDHLHS